MRFEIDTNLTSWECTGNHKLSLFLSLRVEIYCFIWGSCLEKVSVFFLLLLLIYFPSYFFYKVVRNKCENWNFFDLERTLNCWHHLAAILEKFSFWKNAKLIISVIIFLSSFSFFPVLCNLAWGKWSRMILVQRGSSRFAEDSFARTIASSECISYVRCTQDIKHHQYGA